MVQIGHKHNRYMYIVGLYWHMKTLLGRVLLNKNEDKEENHFMLDNL